MPKPEQSILVAPIFFVAIEIPRHRAVSFDPHRVPRWRIHPPQTPCEANITTPISPTSNLQVDDIDCRSSSFTLDMAARMTNSCSFSLQGLAPGRQSHKSQLTLLQCH
ncbi:hypothetical protein DM860_012372 [Cuscuta australis]|uniref:Uncharacterized protein n=1 Tax=Cuscuta australis TaxID=267555 RepID=A0A328DQ08_9ASTE|nr:hypothetical protein DM860_012372 [Cuscuta australis]